VSPIVTTALATFSSFDKLWDRRHRTVTKIPTVAWVMGRGRGLWPIVSQDGSEATLSDKTYKFLL